MSKTSQDQKYCSWCGSPIEFKRFYAKCSTCNYRFFDNPVPSVEIFIFYEGKVLLLKRVVEPRAGSYSLPGGFCNLNEDSSCEEGGVRELKEETNLAVDPGELEYLGSGKSTYLWDGAYKIVFPLMFAAKISKNELDQIILSKENSEFVFIGPEELDTIELAWEHDKQALKKYWGLPQ